MINQELLFNVTGQTFYFDPSEGRPDASPAPTVEIHPSLDDDDGPTESATTGSCSIDSVDTTLSADASAGDSSLTITSATGIARGMRYLLANTEWAEVLGVSGTTITLRQPLRNGYASGATLQGCRISIDVSSTWVADKSKITDILDPTGRNWLINHQAVPWLPGATGYRLRWSYSVNGASKQGISTADLVRYQAQNLVSPLDVDARFPGWLDRLPTDYREDQGAGLIAQAFQSLKFDLMADNQVLRRIRSPEVICELLVYRANVVAQEAQFMAGGNNAEQLAEARKSYGQRYDQLLREPKVPVDQSGGGAAMDPVRQPIFRR